MSDKQKILNELKSVIDPELHFNVVELGLIYGVKIEKDSTVKIDMTLTTPFCPYAASLIEQVKLAIQKVGFDKVEVLLTFDPPYDPSTMASEAVKDALGLW